MIKEKERRVVITGLGVVTPIGTGKNAFWEANIKGISGVDVIDIFDVSNHEAKIAATIKDFDPLKYMPSLVAKRTDRFTQLGLAAAKLAIEDTNLALEKEDKKRIGISVGSGLGGILFHEEQIARMQKGGPKKADPSGVPKVTANAISGYISIVYGLTGPNMTISTACSSGIHGIGYAYDIIRLDKAELMLAGGTEAPITPFTFGSFDALRVLSRRNGDPQKASRPFDNQRDGMVMGEGAAMLILEELKHAKKRGAHIYAEIVGYSGNSGAYHIIMPAPEGKDAAEIMTLALNDAQIQPREIDYINAHGTSTKANDLAETKAIKQVFNNYAHKIPISSTKSMLGHTIGAAGAIETVVCSLAIENNLIPPTINYEFPDPDCDLDYVPNQARAAKIDTVLSNSFGFGSNNACIVLRKF